MNMKKLIILLVVGAVLTIVKGSRVVTFQPKMIDDDVVDIKGVVSTKKMPFLIALRQSDGTAVLPIYIQGKRRQIQVGFSRGNPTFHRDRKIEPGRQFRMLLRLRRNFIEIKMLTDESIVFLSTKFNLGTAPVSIVRGGQNTKVTFRKARWKDYLDLPTDCGHRVAVSLVPTSLCPPIKPFSNERIVGGSPAEAGAHPWQVSIWEKKTGQTVFKPICGGILIANCWVMTAMHCIVQLGFPQNYQVRVGDYYNRNDKDNTQFSAYEDSQNIGVVKMVGHDEYWSVPNARNDIILLRLNNSNSDGTCVRLGRFVQPACLPTEETAFSQGTPCHISGWGATRESQTQAEFPPCLQETVVRLISNDACEQEGSGYPAISQYQRRVLPTMVCASSDSQKPSDSCQGDSGGPLVCEDGSRSIVWGITSWGEGCGTHYGVYTRVSGFIGWMEYQMIKIVKYDPELSS